MGGLFRGILRSPDAMHRRPFVVMACFTTDPSAPVTLANRL
jgi:hypothetical protein